ncbi:MAG TPA: BON domain-containing protein [Gaiellaceae bacterium]|nr:BON domain-containing protein [Gaiellaceae bacterium]
MRKLLTMAGLGAALTYFFDPDSGKRRRAMARDRALAFFRQRGRQLGRTAGGVQAEAQGLVQKAKHARADEKLADPNDASLARKVETEIFRDPEVPKGQIDVNAEDGVVILRGEVERPELIKDLEEKTRSVQGVKGVENLLHTPGTDAPMHQVH